MHAHYVPHAKHVESCRLDEMVKHGQDDSGSLLLLWSLPTATLNCPLPMPLTG